MISAQTCARLLCLSIGLLAGRPAVCGEELKGTATRIFDGDSFMLRIEAGGTVEVRLAEIDAPEKEQPHAAEARTALRGLIFKRPVRAAVIDVDRYGRKVARVQRIEDGLDVNVEMVGQGHAWVYRRWVRDKSLYDHERRAREHRLGLWALPQAQRQSPWQWRREHRQGFPSSAARS